MKLGRSQTLESLFEAPQFSLKQSAKEALLVDELTMLIEHHRLQCPGYSRILAAQGRASFERLADLPYLPVGLFKSHELASIDPADLFKTLTSSGTTGQQVSRIALDRDTADLQTRALASIMHRVLGRKRLPMLIIDSPSVIKDRLTFSARGAGILGMMPFGRDHTYVLAEDMSLDVEMLETFLLRHSGEPFLMFGFTFMVWKHLFQQVLERNLSLDLSQGLLVHSGGWKKLADEAVGNAEFKAALQNATGLTKIHNFYGMVEQVGSVFLEGDDGYLYPPNFADVIIRNPETWEEAPHGVQGVIEVISVLPRSYPGHVLLTEDLGVVHGIGDPESGWSGKRLEVLGRVPKAELRGCSDTHAQDFLKGLSS